MRGSAIYTQISWATICILSQGLREWICNVFFFSPLCVFHISEEERVLNDNAITTVASYWSRLHGRVQGHVAIQGLFDWFQWGEEWLNNAFLAGVKAQEVQTWGDLDWIWTPTELTCDDSHHCTKHLQPVKLVLNTLWEAQWALGIFPAIDERQRGQSESK